MNFDALTSWTPEDAAQLYGIREWGCGFFEVSPAGDVVVNPDGLQGNKSIRLLDIVDTLKSHSLEMPILLRFGDILATRIRNLYQSFQKAMSEAKYQNSYLGVYPIKVNQQQQVVEEIMEFGRPYHHGLEAGSKAELIVALSHLSDPDALLVCNGYKDDEFIDLALHGQRMGLRTILVLEMPGELRKILRRAHRLKIKPRLGIRAKLSTRASGHWTESGGDRSVFGLTASEIIDVLELLQAEGMLDALSMLHYHLGSQIPNIRHIRMAIAEACRFYVDLIREGAPMGILNVGGGLAVDYDGSHTNFPSSCNYTLDEYAADIVESVMDVVDGAGMPHPLLVSESGRATVAHHSVLLFNILDVTRFESSDAPTERMGNAHEQLQNLRYVNDVLTSKNVQECYHDAVYYRDQVKSLFIHGSLSLRERAAADRLFWYIIKRIAKLLEKQRHVPEELSGLKEILADVYHCNFSIFQSLPDSWAIEHLFPIMPIHRLDERPTRQAVLADITCDSDGKINRFVDLHDVNRTLPVHALQSGTDYCLAIFLVGAYQETLGDLHNLLGDTHVVSVHIDGSGKTRFERELYGDTVSDVLSYVEYNTKTMVEQLNKTVEQALLSGKISSSEQKEIVDAYKEGLAGYTYFEGRAGE